MLGIILLKENDMIDIIRLIVITCLVSPIPILSIGKSISMIVESNNKIKGEYHDTTKSN